MVPIEIPIQGDLDPGSRTYRSGPPEREHSEESTGGQPRLTVLVALDERLSFRSFFAAQGSGVRRPGARVLEQRAVRRWVVVGTQRGRESFSSNRVCLA